MAVLYTARAAQAAMVAMVPVVSARASGKVVVKYPDPQAQIALVTNGRRGMPAFETRLTAEEIAAVVEYTRTVLGS